MDPLKRLRAFIEWNGWETLDAAGEGLHLHFTTVGKILSGERGVGAKAGDAIEDATLAAIERGWTGGVIRSRDWRKARPLPATPKGATS